LHGHFSSIGAEHPDFFILGAHVISGGKHSTPDELRDSRVSGAQKLDIATKSMLRGIQDNPSIVAGLGAGKCVAVFLGDWNLDKDSMKKACKLVEMHIMQQSGAHLRQGVISWECQSSWNNNRDWIVTFFRQGLMHPTWVALSEEHLGAYGAQHLAEHQPVVMDFGRIRSLAEQRGDAPALPLLGTTWQDVALVEEQMLQLQLAFVADDARERVQDQDPATTSTATATTP
jgi:hypothetical protein